MRSTNWKLVPALGALLLAAFMVPSAKAACGIATKLVRPSSWQPNMSQARMLPAALGLSDDEDRDDPSIVGMWHVVFTSLTVNGTPIPSPGSLFDNSIVTWHSDGTEIMNSSRPAQDGNFCMGVWEKTGRFTYVLNHIPWQGNDPTNAPSGIGNAQSGAQLLEQVKLSPDGNRYSGTFSFVAYDAAGNPSVSFTGSISATRITIHTPFSALL